MKIKYGMVGGDLTAFIGEVHRKAIQYTTDTELVAGCFSQNDLKNLQTANHYHLGQDRTYKTYQEMAEKEATRSDKIDFVVIVTPNHLHYEIAKVFLEVGVNVVCEKPLCFTVKEAEELQELSIKYHALFAVTYTYTGYSMVKYGRELIKRGKIGEILSINAEYIQDWLISAVHTDSSSGSLSTWRMNPSFSGISNAVGDIGTHIENTVKYMTDLKIKRLQAKTNTFERELDLNANILVEYQNGVYGTYWCSQVALGNPNGFTIRIYGTKGSITWFQETPDYLLYSSVDGVTSKLVRGADYVYGSSKLLNKTPKGHPEGYHEAFANIYKVYIKALKKKKMGEPLLEDDFDFPTIDDGVAGVKFIHAVVKSNQMDTSWVYLEEAKE